tara:strand:+ start:39396 stop:39848 length:453 start_codon:yes stop_codon:yes gene_type:complete
MLVETIQEIIKERKLKLNALADQIGTSPVTLTRNFNGTSEMKLSTLESLIEVVGERNFYTRVLEDLQTLEFVKMDVQDGVVWGVFLVNNVPSFVGCIENNRILMYVKELDTTIYNRKKLEAAVGDGVELEDIKEDTNIVNMWVYQYKRKS